MIALNVCAFQIIQQAPALRDHLKQSAPRMIVLFVELEVFGKFVDSLAEQSYLNLRRSRV
jgi:hypothetical protein